MHRAILPPATIGILGGGQLGRMIALKARQMGYRIHTLDPTPDSPCGQVADKQIVAGFDDASAAAQLAAECAVLTYEFENIGLKLARSLEARYYLPQGSGLLAITQNRLREKKAIQQAGGQVAPFWAVSDGITLRRAAVNLGLPSVLKTTTGGYDGKGQQILTNDQQLTTAGQQVDQSRDEWVLEQFIPFVKELSVVVARDLSGTVACFPVVENIHRQNILHVTIAPARVRQDTAEAARTLAVGIANGLQLVGLLAIEMFLLPDGTLLVNEMAPRPHNSGHFSQQACLTSQFEQHIRAICGLPLGSTEIVRPTVMVNILGEHLPHILNRLPSLDPCCKLHLYGKQEAKPKRKMGHLNVVGLSVEASLERIADLDVWSMEGI